MIPILFEKNETAFADNGIGRLRDCISAVVTEERNSIYELDFQYPVNGFNYEKIFCGRIVGVTHDEGGDVQPFEIVSVTRPINGIVSFHAVHLSYRQSQITVRAVGVNSLSAAFNVLKNDATPENPFTYETDITSDSYMAAADGTPRSVRQMLGGVQGSILDTYGGEFEWDNWRVILHSSRGEARDFAIRYGVNLLDYNDDTNYQGTFTSCMAFWKGSDGMIVHTIASLDQEGYNGNDIRVPLDLTDKFEEAPSVASLQTEALSYMRRNQTNLPAQSIKVDFVRLSEMGEFSAFQDLLKCRLCDTIKVYFPMYNVSTSFKIVKTEWDVLRGTYESMELGTLSATLSDALGITNGLDQTVIAPADHVVDEGTDGIWTFRKWDSGIAECWGIATQTVTTWSAWNTYNYYGEPYSQYNYPSGLFKSGTYPVLTASGGTTTGIANGDIATVGFGGSPSQTGNYQHTPSLYVMRPQTGATGNYAIFIQVRGVWK